MIRDQKFIANWKMNLPSDSIKNYIKIIDSLQVNKVTIIIAVPYPYLFQCKNIVNATNSDIKIAAQNICYKENGAYTGEVSVEMLKDLDIDYVILGHSERRHIFNESDQHISEKVIVAHKNSIQIILCIGETLQERNYGKTFEVLNKQLCVLKNLKNLNNIIIAYEPVWAIGTGVSASTNQIQDAHSFIRLWVKNNFNVNIARSVSIIYGGSVKPENITGIICQNDVDGGLVGSASLKSETFSDIIINSNKKIN